MLVDFHLSQLAQRLIRILFLDQRGVQQFHSLIKAKLGRPSPERAVAGDFIVFDGLGGSEQTRVESGHALVLIHPSLPFGENTPDRVAGFSFWPLAQHFEHLLEPVDLLLRLGLVLLERSAQRIRVCGLGHFRQGSEDFLFGEVDVLQRVVEEILQRFLFGHGGSSKMQLRCRNRAYSELFRWSMRPPSTGLTKVNQASRASLHAFAAKRQGLTTAVARGVAPVAFVSPTLVRTGPTRPDLRNHPLSNRSEERRVGKE